MCVKLSQCCIIDVWLLYIFYAWTGFKNTDLVYNIMEYKTQTSALVQKYNFRMFVFFCYLNCTWIGVKASSIILYDHVVLTWLVFKFEVTDCREGTGKSDASRGPWFFYALQKPKHVYVPVLLLSTWRLGESLLLLPLRSSAPSVAPDVYDRL